MTDNGETFVFLHFYVPANKANLKILFSRWWRMRFWPQYYISKWCEMRFRPQYSVFATRTKRPSFRWNANGTEYDRSASTESIVGRQLMTPV